MPFPLYAPRSSSDLETLECLHTVIVDMSTPRVTDDRGSGKGHNTRKSVLRAGGVLC